MHVVKGIYYCADVALNAGNERKVVKNIEPDTDGWSGLVCISAAAKSGALTLRLGDDTEAAIIDTYAGYSATISVAAVPKITLESTADATVRVLIEKL
jgi:hypothetical protein